MRRIKKWLFILVALAMVAGVTLRGSIVCTDPNNPTLLGTVVMYEGGGWSSTLTAVDPDGKEGGNLTIGIVGEAIPNLTLSPPVVLDSNTISFIGVSPCDLSPIEPNQVTAVSRTLLFEPDFSQAGFYPIIVHLSDGVGGGSWWRWEVTVRPTNRPPFPLRLLVAEGGE